MGKRKEDILTPAMSWKQDRMILVTRDRIMWC